MQFNLLIDGYNLMHAVGLARSRYGPGDLERCRNRLLAHLGSHLSFRERQRAAIVFDAKESHFLTASAKECESIRVFFADPGKEADDMIEELIAGHSAPRSLRVVSTDRRIRQAARRRRAEAITSETFAERLERRGRIGIGRTPAPPSPKQVGLSSPGEVERWLKEFDESLPAKVRDEERTRDRPQRSQQQEIEERPQEKRPADSSKRGGHQSAAKSGRIDTEQDSDCTNKPSQPLQPADEETLAFWERRIAELWDEPDE